jgi:hypothetical protein
VRDLDDADFGDPMLADGPTGGFEIDEDERRIGCSGTGGQKGLGHEQRAEGGGQKTARVCTRFRRPAQAAEASRRKKESAGQK